MKALAIKNENATYCCVCAEELAKASGYPYLFYTLSHSVKVETDDVCQRCGKCFGRHDAECAAERIANDLAPKTRHDG